MFDIAIVGAGPVGLFAIFQAGMLGMRCAVIDSLAVPGGQCSALYPEKPIYDIPAHPKILAQNLIDELMLQAAPFHPVFFLNQQVLMIEQQLDASFKVQTSMGQEITAKVVIVAAGCGAFGPNRPNMHNIESFEGISVFYSVTKKEIFTGKRVVIAGGGDSAIDWALILSEIAAKVYLIHRREKFKASAESLKRIQDRVASGNIEMVIPYQLYSLEGIDGQLESLTVVDLDQRKREIQADYLLPFFGLSMNLECVKSWGLKIENRHVQVDKSTMGTNVNGIFAIGDVVDYPGKLKLILTGFSEAALACYQAYSLINGGAEVHFEYSTTKGVKVL